MTNNDIVEYYQQCSSMRATAAHYHISTQTVRRVLVSSGVIPDGRAAEIAAMQANGCTVDDIAAQLKLTSATVRGYLPYSKGGYATGDKTVNALRIQACRERKKPTGSQERIGD